MILYNFPVVDEDGVIHACVHDRSWRYFAEGLVRDRRRTTPSECTEYQYDRPMFSCRALPDGDTRDVDCLSCLASEDYQESVRHDPRGSR